MFGETAIATYRYEIQWTREDQLLTEGGSDVLVLSRRGGKWRVVWRTILTTSWP